MTNASLASSSQPRTCTRTAFAALSSSILSFACATTPGERAMPRAPAQELQPPADPRRGPNAGEAEATALIADASGPAGPAEGRPTAISIDDVNDSNNPLNPAVTWILQDFYVPEVSSSGAYTNDLFGRVTLPIAPGSVVAIRQIVRASMPVTTRPDPDGGYSTGFGDFSIFDLFMLGDADAFELGVGPLLVLPTASEDELGKGKVQLGLAASAVRESPRGLLGGLVQWATDIAGDDDRDDVSFLQLQPIFTHNIGSAWYLRSTATWGINWDSGDYYVPIGAGIGKVARSGSTLFNFYVEPQFTILHDGDGQPEVTLLFGMTTTLGR